MYTCFNGMFMEPK